VSVQKLGMKVAIFIDIFGIVGKLIACRSTENGVHYRILASFTPKNPKNLIFSHFFTFKALAH
jgi:hypothetical protein